MGGTARRIATDRERRTPPVGAWRWGSMIESMRGRFTNHASVTTAPHVTHRKAVMEVVESSCAGNYIPYEDAIT
jgi:hypothetical protein